MTIDPTLYEESYAAFLTEAQDILQRIEHHLLSLRDDRSPERLHQLMRSAHTLKGAATSVDLHTIQQVAHVLEDIFKALYNPEIEIDAEVEALLFQGYECLRLAITAETMGRQINDQEIIDRSVAVIAQLQEKLGDCFDRDAPIPNSAELGFDIVQSMFAGGVGQRLQALEQAVSRANAAEVEAELQAQAEVFLGLGESLNLPGFQAIAQTTLTALATHPDQAISIAQLALQAFMQGREAILAGDRTQGGVPSAELQALAASAQVNELAAPTTQELSNEAWNGLDTTPEFSLDELFEGMNVLEVPHQEVPSQEVHSSQERSSFRPAIAPGDRPGMPQPVRVDVEQLKHLDYLAGELLIIQNQRTNQDHQMRSGVQALRSIVQRHQRTLYQLQDWFERVWSYLDSNRGLSPLSMAGMAEAAHLPTFSSRMPAALFDVLEMERYNSLRLLLRSALNEAVQLEAETENINQSIQQGQRTLQVQGRLLNQVREDLTTLRMQPLHDLFNRFPRLLQQLAMAHGKPVELKLSGTQVLVDKAVAEKLYDPLLHLVRNAFAHGIETPEIRRSQGKPDQGQIEIRANQQGNQTVIEVKDDGRGIDLQRVAQRAIELGLVTANDINTMPEAQLLDVIFHPGFSTATQVSELSGRGIGLDVVTSQLQAMNGSVAVSTAHQQGTTFSLKIPLSLTATRLLVCQAEGIAYTLPVEQIEQVVIPTPDQLSASIGDQRVLQWSQNQTEAIVPIYSLSRLVQYSETTSRLFVNRSATLHSQSRSASLPSGRQDPAVSGVAPILLMQTIYGRRGLQVDRVLGEQELVVRSFSPTITPPPYAYGSCVFGGGQLALAIDIEVLMQLTTEVELSTDSGRFSGVTSTTQPLPHALHAGASRLSIPSATSPVPSMSAGTDRLLLSPRSQAVLVVDDSLTLRRSLTLLLEQRGYAVLQAENGLEALAQLQQAKVDLVVCDLEMPQVNGFELLSQVSQDPKLSHIPLVVLTSRSSAKHRQIAMELGATAYFTKPYDPAAFLATIARLLPASVSPEGR